ncbi:hypothetical protein RIF29_37866 [Crotalaria pallida]|uniref:Uncharacterized protein n=1 Tax=Crotalaria pallida TaxID=3830 RepID=A0AAN9E4K6_CROPI
MLHTVNVPGRERPSCRLRTQIHQYRIETTRVMQNEPVDYHSIRSALITPVVARSNGADPDEGLVEDPEENADGNP